ncbi:MAG: FAD-binding protein, partial [Pseudomonadota bacterium]
MINDLRRIVGSGNVSEEPAVLGLYSQDQSLSSQQSPFAVVTPHSTDEVQELVRYANRMRVPVVPVSSGIHFHGATIPGQGGMV